MKLQGRLTPYLVIFFIPVVLAVLIASTLGWLSFRQLRDNLADSAHQTERSIAQVNRSAQFNADIAAIQRTVESLLKQAASGSLDQAEVYRTHGAIVNRLATLDAALPAMRMAPDDASELTELRSDFERYRNLIIMATDAAAISPPDGLKYAYSAADAYLDLAEHTHHFAQRATQAAAARNEVQVLEYDQLGKRLGTMGVVLLLALLLAWGFIAYKMMRRMAVLSEALQSLSEGTLADATYAQVLQISKENTSAMREVAGSVLSFRSALHERQEAQAALKERIKELSCLYDVFQLTEQDFDSFSELLEAVAQRLPAAMRFPELAVSCIQAPNAVLGNALALEQPNFIAQSFSGGAESQTFELCIAYTGMLPVDAGEPFLHEERELAQAIAQRLSHVLALRRTQAQQREVQDLVNAIFEQAAGAINLIDRQTLCIVRVNEASCRILGYTRDELAALRLTDLQADPSQERLHARVQRVADTGNASFENRYRRKDGQIIDVFIHAVTIAQHGREYIISLWEDVTEKKQKERLLRKLSTAVEQSPHAVVITNLEGNIVFINEAFERSTGYRRDEVLGRNPRFLQSGKTPKAIYVALWNALLAGEQWHGTFTNRTKEGQERIESAIITPIRDTQGVITSYVAVKEDITERVHAEETLRKLFLAVEQSPESIVITNLDAQIEYVNRAFTRATGYSAEEAKGLNPRVLQSGQTPKATYDDMWATLTRGETWRGLLINKRKDGSLYEEQAHITPVRQADGQVTHFLAIKEDVTEKRRVAAELANYREHLEELVEQRTAELARATESLRLVSNEQAAIFDTASSGVALIKDRVLIRCNRRLHEILGWNPGALEGQRTRVWYASAQDEVAGGDPVYAAIWHGQTHVREAQLIRKDGSRFWARMAGKAVDVQDPSKGSVWVIDDITAEREATKAITHAKEMAEDAARTKSDFLANMSHEIRTPMNAIIGMSHLALKTHLDPKQRNFIEKVHQAGTNLLGIINDILDFSKIEAGKMSMESMDFRLEDVIDNLAIVMGFKAEEKGLELIFDASADVPTSLVGDPLRLGQVLINLGNNAVKFTEHGEIVIGVECVHKDAQGVELHFWVRDTGIGLTPAQCGRMFQSFSQADASTTRKYGGTGLGLAISKNLVEMMQGRIWVESEFGKGSVFHFHAHFGLQDAKAVQRMFTAEELRGMRLLVVDDNAAAREILSDMARSFGLVVQTAHGGENALTQVQHAHAQGTPFDLILTDWKMPDMDGVRLVRLLQQGLVPTPPAVIMVTAYGRDEALKAAAEQSASIHTVLTKPATPSSLLEAIGETLHKENMVQSWVAPSSGGTNEAMRRLQGARILLVEDNLMNQELVVELLAQAGVSVVLANHGQEALDLLALDTQFDGILMDCQMPVMDGYEATRAIRSNPILAQMPIVAMTANAMAGDREKVLEAGMCDHIAKPLDVDAMFTTLARWIQPTAVPGGATPAALPAAVSAHKAVSGLPAQLPGIDMQAGLATTMKSEKLYRRLLLKFRDTQSQFPTQFASARASDDTKAAERVAHTLRGTAGNIGAKALQALAGQLEQACRDQAPSEVIEAQLHAVQEALDTALRGLSQLDDETESLESAPAKALDLAQLNVVHTELEALLQDGNPDAVQLWDEHIGLFQQAYPTHWARIDAHLRGFDFEAASDAVGQARQATLTLAMTAENKP